MLDQPMSSPMMKMMLGRCGCCAAAGTLANVTTANNARTVSEIALAMLMPCLLGVGCCVQQYRFLGVGACEKSAARAMRIRQKRYDRASQIRHVPSIFRNL